MAKANITTYVRTPNGASIIDIQDDVNAAAARWMSGLLKR